MALRAEPVWRALLAICLAALLTLGSLLGLGLAMKSLLPPMPRGVNAGISLHFMTLAIICVHLAGFALSFRVKAKALVALVTVLTALSVWFFSPYYSEYLSLALAGFASVFGATASALFHAVRTRYLLPETP